MATQRTMMQNSIPPTTRTPKTRRYQDYLTPYLHRKFVRAATTALGICFIEAICISEASTLPWRFSPIGTTGIRALLLFISVMILFLARVSQARFGHRTAVSPIAEINQLAKSFELPRTLIHYLISAWWFSEIYVWSASNGADLGWVHPDDDNGRDRLNERPIFLRSNMGLLAIVMAVVHLYYDYDRIDILQYPTLDDQKNATPYKTGNQVFRGKAWETIRFGVSLAAAATFANFIFYAVFFRRFAWAWSLWFGRLIWDVPRSAEPSTIPPYHWTLIIRSFISGILLVTLWQLSNLAWSAWICQPPTKHNKPLTSEARDPNGSLITGLKAKKSTIKVRALWELCLISTNYEDRRKTIFSEVDRSDGESTWKQVLSSCIAIIESTNLRLEDNRTPPPDLVLAASKEKEVKHLPRLSAPLKADAIVQALPKPTTRTQWAESEIGSLVKSNGQTPTQKSKSNGDSPARKILEQARNAILTPDQQKSLQPEHLAFTAQSLTSQALGTALGAPFRQTFARRVQAKVFGSPRSELPAILLAVQSISQLAVAGITEDTMGTVNRDIPLIMRTFGNIIGRIQKFTKESQSHWTDSNQGSSVQPARRVEEVEFLVGYLRGALRHIIQGYEGYARDMGISSSELRTARLAAGLE